MYSRRKMIAMLSTGTVGLFVGKLFGIEKKKEDIKFVDLTVGEICVKRGYGEGTKSFEISYYKDGQLHKVDGPAFVRYNDNGKVYLQIWYQNDKLHRTDGPAIEWANGNKYWYVNGKRHRIGGPAAECANGTKQWWLNGKEVTVTDCTDCTNW